MSVHPARHWLPLWTLLPATLPASLAATCRHWPRTVSCLLLKDGTLSVGVRWTQDAAPLAAEQAFARELLSRLPDGGFVQAISRIHGGDEQNAILNSQPLSATHKKGGQRQHTTIWFGCKRYLQEAEQTSSRHKRHARCIQFLQSFADAIAWLVSRYPDAQCLHPTDIVQQCQRILRGPGAAAIPACASSSQIPWGHAYLDEHLAQGGFEHHEQYLRWRGRASDALSYVQASSVISLSSFSTQQRLAGAIASSPAAPVVWSVCHEKCDQQEQKRSLLQRDKWLYNMLDNPSFPQEEAKAAWNEAHALLVAIRNQGAQIFRSSITCLIYGNSADSLERQSQEAADSLRACQAQLTVDAGQQAAVLRSALPGCGYQAPTGLSLLDAQSALLWPAHFGATKQSDQPSRSAS